MLLSHHSTESIGDFMVVQAVVSIAWFADSSESVELQNAPQLQQAPA